MKKHGILIKTAGVFAAFMLLAFSQTDASKAVRSLPDTIYADGADALDMLSCVEAPYAVNCEDGVLASSQMAERLYAGQEQTLSVDISLLGVIPIKTVTIAARNDTFVMPGGLSVGVTMLTDGALVVGLGEVEAGGELYSPAAYAGIRVNDIITAVDGEPVKDADGLTQLISASEGVVTLSVERSGESLSLDIRPAVDSATGMKRLGMWVRDSTAGIGTLSMTEPNSMSYGALGHAITDVDTGALLKVREGELIQAGIVGVRKGTQGTPGEIKGTFSSVSRRLGSIEDNTATGIYGALYQLWKNPFYPDGLPLAYPSEVRIGPATILTTVDAKGVREFDCEIVKLFEQNEADTKGMVIRITDVELLEITGGIVQGMSGSPVIQDGRLAGVVTHVFINDPTRGYGIYACWMYEEIMG